MNQGTLFDNSEPLARSGDEPTSHMAAARLTESGKRSSQKGAILRWMLANGVIDPFTAMTSAEIAGHSGLPHPSVHKRLPDLRCDGHVRKWHPRKCQVTGSECVTWYAVVR